VLNLEEISLRAVIDRALAAAAPRASESRLDIRREPAQENVMLRTDPDRLAQVFSNLVANAAKYCEAPAPQLRIAVLRQGQNLAVDFIDNGRGIPKASQDVVFEKFARLSDTARAGGAGLGLAICREITVKLGGSIAYLPGQGGAAFRVTLPLTAAASVAAS
jgi:signal transduction histidine kinase